jgi:hypothetical protein
MKLKIKLEERLGELLQERAQHLSSRVVYRWFYCKNDYRSPRGISIFRGGVVTYSNRSKSILLMVPEEVISKKGAVSKEVAEAMAKV